MRRLAIATLAILLTTALLCAQERASTQSPANEPQGTITSSQSRKIVIPAGTRIPLSLLISIHTKLARRGDLVHLETQYPIVVGTEIAVPAGTYVEGVIDKVLKRDSGSPTAALQMHFTRLSFTNGYEVRLDGAILQAHLGSPADMAADTSERIESAGPAVFVNSAYVTGPEPWNFGPMGFQAHGKPSKPSKPKDPKGPAPAPTPTPTPVPTPTPPPSPTPTPPPAPTPPPPSPTPPPAPTPTPTPPPAPTPPTIPAPTSPTPTPSPTITMPGSGTSAGVGIGIGAVAAAVGGVFMAKHRGADTVIEEGTQFYMVLQTSLAVERQAVADMMP